jgi:hypothetical protein
MLTTFIREPSKMQINNPSSQKTVVSWFLGALALLVWVILLIRAATVFGPDSAYVQPFNSDSALPVLMANDETIDAFRTYIYGQDQVGAWPFILGQLVHRATGYVWTDRSIYFAQTFWLFLGVLVIAALSREWALISGTLFLLTICLHPTVAHYVFVLNQRNAWQITALFFSWWAIRRVCGYHFGQSDDTRRRAVLWQVLAGWFVFLSCWMSPVSIVIVCAFYVLEVVRVCIAASDPDAARLNPKRLLVSFAPVALGLICEQLLKANYHRFALKHFGSDYRTPLEFDSQFLWVNLKIQLAALLHSPWSLLTLFGLIAGPVVFLVLLRCVTTATDRLPRICLPGARLDVSVLLAGSSVIALTNLAISVVFTWTRLNNYGGRYLALTHLFGSFAGFVSLLLLVGTFARGYSSRRLASPILASVFLLLLMIKFPEPRKEPDYDTLRSVAAALAQKAPGAVLLGGYWDTYIFPALEPQAHLVPVPAQDQQLRTPWTSQLLRESRHVVVVHHVFPPTGATETPSSYNTFGDGLNPPSIIRQYGATLHLVESQWFKQNGYVFSLYDNEGGG